MQPRLTSSLFAISVIALFFFITGCKKNDDGKSYSKITLYKPVLSSKQSILDKINGNTSEPIVSSGKLFIKDNFIYLNEVEKGIHVIDNSNPSKPTQVAFLSIPGNIDVAVRENILYADMGADLIALDISNPKKAVLKADLSNFFPYRYSEKGYYNPIDENTVVTSWIKKDTMVENYNNRFPGGIWLEFALASADVASFAQKSGGTSGSMASIVLMKDHLYAITEPHSIGVVDISTPASPVKKENFYAGFDLETIFPFKDKLFLGSSIGMFMYDVSDPNNPVQLGTFSHGRACDPVIAEDDYAFVTLRTGSTCGGSANELHVVDIKNLTAPQLVKTYQLTNPAGLSKDNNLLFVCDGTSGVRLFDATDISKLEQIGKIGVPDPYDVIAADGHALVSAKTGLFQYDYSNPKNIKQLSFFATGTSVGAKGFK